MKRESICIVQKFLTTIGMDKGENSELYTYMATETLAHFLSIWQVYISYLYRAE